MNGESVHLFSPLHHSFHSVTTHFIPNYWLQYSLISLRIFCVACFPPERTFSLLLSISHILPPPPPTAASHVQKFRE